ncbi:MAG: enoyl-CoA hydratase/isomerase family protein [Streptosporangiaceae bacterium]
MTDSARYETIDWSQDGPVLVLTLNRPDHMNALSSQLEQEMHAAVQAAAAADSVRAIVLTGAGRAFSAGYDLVQQAQARPTRTRDVLKRSWDGDMGQADKLLAFMRLPKPIIAAVNGWCLGGGLWYSLACDITIASDQAVFGQPEVREIQNSTFLFSFLVGYKNASRYALTGDHFDAREAERIGMVNQVVPHDELMPTAMALAQRLALVPPDSVRLNKMITVLGLEAMGLRAAMETADILSVITHSSMDAADLDELNRLRHEEGLAASLKFRDGPFIPEPGGPRSRPREKK